MLAGLQARRAYVSLGPQVAFEAHVGGRLYSKGADLGLQDGEVELTIKLTEAEGAAMLGLIHNGLVAASAPLSSGKGEVALRLALAPERQDWFRAQVSSPQGAPLAITNPIFSGPQERNEEARFGDYLPTNLAKGEKIMLDN